MRKKTNYPIFLCFKLDLLSALFNLIDGSSIMRPFIVQHYRKEGGVLYLGHQFIILSWPQYINPPVGMIKNRIDINKILGVGCCYLAKLNILRIDNTLFYRTVTVDNVLSSKPAQHRAHSRATYLKEFIMCPILGKTCKIQIKIYNRNDFTANTLSPFVWKRVVNALKRNWIVQYLLKISGKTQY